tara:strand:+ start:7691 stop:8227 length:537 start_codon:yes stop_codon:yes gene_type:complete
MKKSKNLEKLYDLVGGLCDRDTQLKRDMQLFESFFDSFPIPVTMWSVTKEKAVISQRGNGFICSKASCLEELFSCPIIRDKSLVNHEKALRGETTSYFVQTDKTVHYVKLVPRRNDTNEISGVSGIAWDVTVNAVLLSCLEDINDMTSGKRGMYKEIHDISSRAMSASHLRNLLAQED